MLIANENTPGNTRALPQPTTPLIPPEEKPSRNKADFAKITLDKDHMLVTVQHFNMGILREWISLLEKCRQQVKTGLDLAAARPRATQDDQEPHERRDTFHLFNNEAAELGGKDKCQFCLMCFCCDSPCVSTLHCCASEMMRAQAREEAQGDEILPVCSSPHGDESGAQTQSRRHRWHHFWWR